MYYCDSCKKIYKNNDSRCPDCRKKLKKITDINEPVAIGVVGGTERAMLTGMLKDNDIPFIEQHVTPQGVSDDILTGYDVKLSNIIVLVPYSALPKAYELSKNIEINNSYIEELLDEIGSDIEKAKKEKEKPQMSSAKRTTIKIISAIVFLIIIALVVFGTDYVMGFIKSLFGG